MNRVFSIQTQPCFVLKDCKKENADPFIEATQLTKGKKLLDCTFGLGSDSITASYIVGEQGLLQAVKEIVSLLI